MASDTTYPPQRRNQPATGSVPDSIAGSPLSPDSDAAPGNGVPERYRASVAPSPQEQPLLSMEGLSHVFMRRQGILVQTPFYALNNINLSLAPGKTLGLVGESGCGKSTLARVAAGLMPPTEGVVRIDGKPLYNKHSHENYAAFRKEVCRIVQMVFQDPQASLNPRMRIGESVAEPLVCLEAGLSASERKKRVDDTLLQVGMAPEQASRYPHEFSGGQRQRIAIARALAIRPRLVICDEPTSSLDSSVQAQVLNLLAEMQESLGLAYLFISHDLAVVRHMSDTVAVMYAGTIVEYGPVEDVFGNPVHPYTQLLFSSAMGVTPVQQKILRRPAPEAGAPSPLLADDAGCPFQRRCPLAEEPCRKVFPPMGVLPGSCEERFVRCPVVLHQLNSHQGGTGQASAPEKRMCYESKL